MSWIKNKLVSPVLKWVGGKRQLLPQIVPLLPRDFNRLVYYEPFIGGGAVLFAQQPKKAVISDYNAELINVYRVVRDNPDELLECLGRHENTEQHYYHVRGQDRDPLFCNLTNVEKAARVIFLNKTCYNGLYRVNNAGEFNVPYGYYKKPNIVNAPVIKAVSRYLRENQIEIENGDFEEVLSSVSPKSFVYLDPPYHPISQTSNFTGYVQGGWSALEQIRLRDVCLKLHNIGARFLLSNSSSPFIRELYESFNITTVSALRAVNSDGNKRGSVDEVLIRNYD